MGYQFKLEALRKYRQFEEERLQKEFSDALRLLEQAHAELAGQVAKRRRCEQEFMRRIRDGEPAPQAAMYRLFLQRLSEDIAAGRSNVASANAVCEKAREALAQAMKRRKMLDRLKEKGHQAFLADLDSAEQKFINEMAISRFTRKSR